jgi:hypothetical protein
MEEKRGEDEFTKRIKKGMALHHILVSSHTLL